MLDMEQVEPLVLTDKHSVRHGAGGAFGPYRQTHDNMSDMEQVETSGQTNTVSDMEQVEPLVLTDKHMTIC